MPAAGLVKRAIAIDRTSVRADGERKIIRFACASDAVIDRWGDREILTCDAQSVQLDRLRAVGALVLDHDPRQRVAAIRSAVVEGGKLIVEAEFGRTARAQEAAQEVEDGLLRGVSIGYSVEQWDVDEKTRTYRAVRWTPYEVTLTAVPVDTSVGIGRAAADPEQEVVWRAITQPKPKEAAVADPVIPAAEDFKARAIKAEAEAAKANLALELRAVADAHSLDVSDLDLRSFASKEAGLAEMLKRASAKQRPSDPQQPITPAVRVGADAADKFITAAVRGLCGEADGIRMGTGDLMRRSLSFHDREVENISRADLERRAIQSLRTDLILRADGPNKQTNTFATVLGNAANKTLLAGFDRYVPVWERFCNYTEASDFNIHPHAAIANGRLLEVPEGMPAQELAQKEGSYNSQLKMWAATLTITEQALANDGQLGEIMRSFARYGYSAARCIEREVFRVLLNATWTNDTTAAAAIGTAGNLDKARRGLKAKLSPAGEMMDHDPKVIVVDPLNRLAADNATGAIYRQGTTQSAVGSNAVAGLEVVDSTFVGDTTLLGGALTTDYYVFADKMVCDTIAAEFRLGQGKVPRIGNYDLGAVLGVGYLIALPFAATVATHADSAAATRVSGIQKATVA